VTMVEATRIMVRPMTLDDRAAVQDIILTSGVFGEADAACVDEMILETWELPRVDSYRWLACCDGQHMIGFACYGVESLTQDTWDLFWICVRPEARGLGAGRALIAEVKAEARAANGRLMVIYTSSMPKFAPARGLYERAGFERSAIVPDYYSDGDDLYIYRKRLTSN
jgi:ribosomal protein S18 acetylase RimI-like enzyme